MTAQPPPPQTRSSEKPSMTPGRIAGVILLVLALVFIFENTKKVHVRLIGPEVHAPLFVFLLIAAVLGGLATLLLQFGLRRRSR